MNALQTILESNISRTVLAAAAICVTLLLYHLNKKRRSLSYRVGRNQPLFKMPDRHRSRIQMTVDGVAVKDVSLVVLEIANTGNEPIKAEDFYMPLTFSFGPEAEVLSTQVLRTKPPDLGASVSTEGSEVVVTPILLNKGDKLTIETLLVKSTLEISHRCRIVGVPAVKNVTDDQSVKRYFIVRSWTKYLLIFSFSYLIFEVLESRFHPATYYHRVVMRILEALMLFCIAYLSTRLIRIFRWD